MEGKVTLMDAWKMMAEPGNTAILPYLLGQTKTKVYEDSVIKVLRKELNTPEFTRIYLFFQQGVTKRKTMRIWNELQRRAASLDLNAKAVQICAFGNVPLDVRDIFFAMAVKFVDLEDHGHIESM